DLTGLIVTEAFKNPLLEQIFVSRREVSGQQVIAQESSMVRLLKHTKRGGFGGILIDLNLPPTQAATIIESFGMKTCVTFLHAVLAHRAGVRIVPFDTAPLPDGSCRVRVHPPLTFASDATPPE